MSEAHRPGARPYPYLSPFLAFSSHLEPVAHRSSGLRDAGFYLSVGKRFLVVYGEKLGLDACRCHLLVEALYVHILNL
jgi:hypothetical protein